MMFPKRKRIVDLKLLTWIRTLPCMACLQRPVDAHHVTSRGAGGGDVASNVIPLCAAHHRQWHDRGAHYMMRSYPAILNWVRLAHRDDLLEGFKESPRPRP